VILRPYQTQILNAFEEHNYRRLIPIIPRRGGKDFVAIQLALRAAVRTPCTILYVLPTYNQARDTIWEGHSFDGIRLLDYFPDEICKKNNSYMKITFKHNGSIIKFCGSDKYDRLRGTNPAGVILSEYAYQHPRVFDVLSPCLAANKGWACFISTPCSKNHFYDLYQFALKNPKEWFSLKLTVDDTKHVEPEELAAEKERFSTERFLQEYYSSFECGMQGAIYAHYIKDMYDEHRIGEVLYDAAYPVHTAWDIGISDATAIIFFQLINNAVNIIGYYENRGEGAPHYVEILKSKPYVYGHHIMPHDTINREWGSGLSRIEQLANYGIHPFRLQKPKRRNDKIEAGRVTIRRVRIDKKECKVLINALQFYHYDYNDKHEIFRDTDGVHDWSSHAADAFGYMSLGIPLISDDFSAQDLDELRMSAVSSLGPRSYGKFK
jgi:hypothetical protein